MRIISGNARGRKIKSAKGKHLRPTSDLVKGAIFNIIGENVKSACVLDLFAGSGSLGLEALSRGVNFSTFVESSATSCRLIHQNLKLLGFERKAKVIRGEVFSLLSQLVRKGFQYDLIFADPPYLSGLATKVLKSLMTPALIKEKGLLIIQHHQKESLSCEEGEFSLLKSKRYGLTVISFYAPKHRRQKTSEVKSTT
ncbi:MAG: 16S rRNA (guanine(966)-N(2))-methyltransferase RsmD [Candidatus Edwardsbacteria bacterium]